jgi:hypothetical protein
MGLEFGHPQGAKFVMKRLYENGVWAIFSTLDPRVLQYKPGILLTPGLCEELLERTEVAIGKARDDIAKGRGAAWTEERRRSDEGPPPQAARPARRRLEAPGGEADRAKGRRR